MRQLFMIAIAGAALLAPADPATGSKMLVRTEAELSESARAQPDTSSPNWKALSDDVGMLIRSDDRLGLRARLYVRVRGEWRPVAPDGVSDIFGAIPVR